MARALERALALLSLVAFGVAALAGCGSAPTRAHEMLPPARESLEITYLGVAGWRVGQGEHVVLLDPYFTRAPVENPAEPLLPDLAAIDRFAPREAELILVGHSHYDHLLDVPSIAQRTGARVAGSASTLNVARAAGLPEQRLQLAEPTRAFSQAPFSILPIASLHSLIGIPDAPIPAGVALPLTAKDYNEGGTLAYLLSVGGRSLLFIDTANFIESALTGLHPDVLVAAIGLREKVPDYTCRLLRALAYPKVVLPNHFDAHWQPLVDQSTPIDAEQLAAVERFRTEVSGCSPATRVIVPRRFERIAL